MMHYIEIVTCGGQRSQLLSFYLLIKLNFDIIWEPLWIASIHSLILLIWSLILVMISEVGSEKNHAFWEWHLQSQQWLVEEYPEMLVWIPMLRLLESLSVVAKKRKYLNAILFKFGDICTYKFQFLHLSYLQQQPFFVSYW